MSTELCTKHSHICLFECWLLCIIDIYQLCVRFIYSGNILNMYIVPTNAAVQRLSDPEVESSELTSTKNSVTAVVVQESKGLLSMTACL